MILLWSMKVSKLNLILIKLNLHCQQLSEVCIYLIVIIVVMPCVCYAVPVDQEYQEICILVQGVCSSASPSQFYINGRSISRPRSNTIPYSLTYSFDSGTYSFCFRNITHDAVLIEYCYQAHVANCLFCPVNFGEVEFLSRTDIFFLESSRVDDQDQEPSKYSAVKQLPILIYIHVHAWRSYT
jgi:hypothetical protein